MWYPDIHDIPNFDFQLGFKHRVLYTKVEIWVTSHGLMKNRGIQCLLTLPDPFVWANYSCYLIIIHKLEIRLPNLNILNKLKKNNLFVVSVNISQGIAQYQHRSTYMFKSNVPVSIQLVSIWDFYQCHTDWNSSHYIPRIVRSVWGFTARWHIDIPDEISWYHTISKQNEQLPTVVLACFGCIITGWWFQPLWKILLVSWDCDIPNIWKNSKCSKTPTR